MNTLQEDNYKTKVLCRQDVESPNSSVNRINFASRKIDFRYTSDDTQYSEELYKYKVLFEAIYGYRKNDINRLKRATPSAGALYPTELLLLKFIDNCWQLFHYDFKKHSFFSVQVADIEQLIEDINPSVGRAVILFYSAFERTIQKYGVRSFRYVYLDSAFILYNLSLVNSAWESGMNLIMHFPKKSVAKYLAPINNNTLLFSVSLDDIFEEIDFDVAQYVPDFSAEVGGRFAENYLNDYNANFLRVYNFYIKACSAQQAHDKLLTQVPADLSKQDALNYLINRDSVKSFSGAPLSCYQYEAIKNNIAEYGNDVSSFFDIKNYEIACVPINVLDVRPGIEYIVSGTSKNISNSSKDAVCYEIMQACQEQVIMQDISFLLVVLMDTSDLSASSEYTAYIKNILFSGLVCSKLYQLSLFNGLGTTTIGGFSEKKINNILKQNNYLPIVVQAFGARGNSTSKYDNSAAIRMA